MTNEWHDFESDIRRTIADYVELQREVIEQMSGTESVAQRVYDSVSEAIIAIKSPVDPGIAVALSRFRSLPAEYVEPALELFTARAFEVLLPNMVQLEKRIENVIDFAHTATPSHRASATLSKIARCYLLGLDAETIAMCRAALDVSVSDVVDSLEAATAAPASMRQKVELLRSTGRLSEADKNDALEVWRQGNEVLHSNIEDVRNAREVVAKTMRVIGALFPLVHVE